MIDTDFQILAHGAGCAADLNVIGQVIHRFAIDGLGMNAAQKQTQDKESERVKKWKNTTFHICCIFCFRELIILDRKDKNIYNVCTRSEGGSALEIRKGEESEILN